MSLTIERPVRSPELADTKTTLPSEAIALGKLATLRADIIAYVGSNNFLARLASQAASLNTPDFHAVRTKQEDGYITQVTRRVALSAQAEPLVDITTTHNLSEELIKPPLTNWQNYDPLTIIEKARGHLVHAGLEGEALDQAEVFIIGPRQAYKLQGEVLGGPDSNNLHHLSPEELIFAADDPVIELVRAGFARLHQQPAYLSLTAGNVELIPKSY